MQVLYVRLDSWGVRRVKKKDEEYGKTGNRTAQHHVAADNVKIRTAFVTGIAS